MGVNIIFGGLHSLNFMSTSLNIFNIGLNYSYAERGFSFAAIELLDSDKDGYTNQAEFKALTFPGNPKDFPRSTVVTATPLSTPISDECSD
jgi:hypothetical protein